MHGTPGLRAIFIDCMFKNSLPCFCLLFIYVYLKASWDVEGIKDLKDVLRTCAVVQPEKTTILLHIAEHATFKFCRLFSNNYRLRQPMNWAPFENAPRTRAAFPASRILDDSSAWQETSKTESWATPVSNPSSLARPLQPRPVACHPFIGSPQDSSYNG